MIHMLGASILMVFSIHFFSLNYTLSKINTAYFGLYKGVVENAVIISDADGNELTEPVFSSTLMKYRVDAYLETTVKPYCRYKARYYYLDKEGKPVADNGNQSLIIISFYPNGWKTYTRTACFQISKGISNHG